MKRGVGLTEFADGEVVSMKRERGMKGVIAACGLAVGLLVSGCGFHAKPLAIGAVGGGAAGAATGAIVGAVIANGDVAASALLGGAIGIPAGLVVAAIYDYNSERSVRERKDALIMENQAELFARQREIEALRERVRDEGRESNPPAEYRDYQFTGPTLGSYYR